MIQSKNTNDRFFYKLYDFAWTPMSWCEQDIVSDKQGGGGSLLPIVTQVNKDAILRRNLSHLFICAEQTIQTNETCIDN